MIQRPPKTIVLSQCVRALRFRAASFFDNFDTLKQKHGFRSDKNFYWLSDALSSSANIDSLSWQNYQDSIREQLPSGEADIVVALSGGADSLSLAAVMAWEGYSRSKKVAAVVVDHGLQEGSAEVAAVAAHQAAKLGCFPVSVIKVDTGIFSGGTEAAARNARYNALSVALECWGASFIALGHTLDDQAETVLLGLSRGSGSASLSGMKECSDALIRPFLSVNRSDTVQYCSDAGLNFWMDPHNDDYKFARVRVRQKVLPFLEAELGPGISDSLGRTALLLQHDIEAIDSIVDDLWGRYANLSEDVIFFMLKDIVPLPKAFVSRLLRKACCFWSDELISYTQTNYLLNFVFNWQGQDPLELYGVKITRKDNIIYITNNNSLREA